MRDRKSHPVNPVKEEIEENKADVRRFDARLGEEF